MTYEKPFNMEKALPNYRLKLTARLILAGRPRLNLGVSWAKTLEISVA